MSFARGNDELVLPWQCVKSSEKYPCPYLYCVYYRLTLIKGVICCSGTDPNPESCTEFLSVSLSLMLHNCLTPKHFLSPFHYAEILHREPTCR